MKQEKKAIALKYPEWAEAPFISVNAKGFLAEAVLRIAEENHVPIKKDEVLAQVLSLYQVGSYIPAETYEALAKIFAFIMKCEQYGTQTN